MRTRATVDDRNDGRSTHDDPADASPPAACDFEREVLARLSELRGTALRLTRSPAAADDLLQETGLRAWRFRAHFTPDSNVRAWLHRILVNTFIHGWRRQRREREVYARFLAEPARPTCVAAIDGALLGDEVSAALAALQPEFRAVFVRVDLLDQSYRDVAEALGCPIGTVMSRLHRARRALQRALAEHARAEGYAASAAA
jgi:RNA polymerase sigma-70 factor (ECF subfamily)